jgi:hypothetical protein
VVLDKLAANVRPEISRELLLLCVGRHGGRGGGVVDSLASIGMQWKRSLRRGAAECSFPSRDIRCLAG